MNWIVLNLVSISCRPPSFTGFPNSRSTDAGCKHSVSKCTSSQYSKVTEVLEFGLKSSEAGASKIGILYTKELFFFVKLKQEKEFAANQFTFSSLGKRLHSTQQKNNTTSPETAVNIIHKQLSLLSGKSFQEQSHFSFWDVGIFFIGRVYPISAI